MSGLAGNFFRFAAGTLLAVSTASNAKDLSSPAIAVKMPVGNHPAIDSKGFAELLMTDLIVTFDETCGGRVVEWLRRADAIKELERQQGRAFNPATRLPLGELVQPDFFVETTISGPPDTFTYKIEVKDAITGEVVATDGETVPADKVFEAEDRLGKRLPEKLCKQRAGYSLSGRMDDGTITGTICGKLDRPFTASSPEVGGAWKFTPTGPASGKFSYSASNIGGVPGSGSGTYVIARTKDGAEEIKLSGTGAVHSPLGTFTAEITESIRLTPTKTCGRVGNK